MSADRKATSNSTAMAVAIRDLAREAHRLLSAPAPDERAAEILLARIDRARRALVAPGSSPIARWLENLRREVEETCLPLATG